MEEKLQELYLQCIKELDSIGINIENIGTINISISKRANKIYGCCKQEEPNKSTRFISRVGCRRIIKYEKFNKHNILISAWVMELNDDIIKNTIMHELIHCFPYCNNHGKEFKMYAKVINSKLGYNITRAGNRELDSKDSNVKYEEKNINRYKIECEKCGQTFFRQRCNKNLTRRYRCAKCGGKLKVEKLV